MRNQIVLKILLLALLGAQDAWSWDGATVVPSGHIEAPLQLRDLQLSADGNGWANDDDGHILRFRNGQVLHAEQPSNFGMPRFSYVTTLLPDGGAVAMTYGDSHCELLRFTSEGRLRWRSPHCGEAIATADGTLWIIPNPGDTSSLGELRRLGTDGSVIAVPDPTVLHDMQGNFDRRRRLFTVPAGDGLLAVSAVAASGGGVHASIRRLDRSGNVAWRWQSDERWQADTTAAVVTVDGAIVLSGTTPVAAGADTSQLQVARVSPDGRLSWINRATTHATDRGQTVLAHRNGEVSVHAGGAESFSFQIVRMHADGAVAWRRDIDIESFNLHGNVPVLTENSNADTIVVGGNSYGAENSLRYVRLSANGERLVNRLIAGSGPLRAGDNLLMSESADAWLMQINDQGDLDPSAYSSMTVPSPILLAASHSGTDGSEFLLTVDADEDLPRRRYSTTRVDADGRIAWRRDQIGDVKSGVLASNAARLCSFTRRARTTEDGYATEAGHVECLDVATGEVLWQREIVSATNAIGVVMLPDNRVLLAYSRYTSHTLDLLDAGGRTLRSEHLGSNVYRIHTSRSGYVAVQLNPDFPTEDRIAVYGPDLQRRYVITAAMMEIGGWPNFHIDENGAVTVYGTVDGSLPLTDVRGIVYHIDPATNRSWRVVLPTLQKSGYAARLLSGDDAIYVAQRVSDELDHGPRPPQAETTRIVRLDRSSGTLSWSADSENTSGLNHVMELSADGERVVSVHGERRRMRVEHYDSRNGQRLAESRKDCAAAECDPAKLINGSDGVSRLVARIHSGTYGSGVAVYRQRNFDQPAASTRLDQPGIAGAWWSPYANGEGIAFDWLPASRTLFGAWFTYSTTGGNEPSELRWYTLQANGVGIGARELTLPILETIGGNFAAGPSVSPRQIGSARLTFHDCSKATLAYTFDAEYNDARSGTISLSRLSPAAPSCVLADGSTAPAPGATPPSNGFDARLSGTWFDGATAGQGLQFTVQPGGVFFAPWFTFDPVDAANDTGRQHWFTLQGNLADARNGTAELVLVQTIGGRFDSLPTYNANAVGSATLRVQGCDRAELDYRFDDAPGSGAFRGLRGTLQLARAGGCAP
ncbi:MAG: hypothetical protein AMXMBFR59_06380 [Rhodanobacteraceae bacterium]